MVVSVKFTGKAVEPTLYSIFFEDINFAADSGLYAELIKILSFEFYEPMMGWSEPQVPSVYLSRPEFGSFRLKFTGEG